ncbi:MAG TPA: OmpH family outer membrane protein [Sedimentisphaerales bacterium]|nr:OmpH family outer membrane protein [Sedimentisphaerales bacterium]
MKARTMVLGCLAGVVILAMGYEYSQAQPKGDTPSSKIGTVSIMKVFRDCKRSAAHRTEIYAEQNRIRAELEKLSKEIEAQEAGLKALKQDSSDYLAQRKELIDKRASLQAQQDFNKEQIILKEYRWSKELYNDILQITSELAEQKGLDLVLEKDEIDIFALSVNEISQTIRTHKVLYNGGCVDFTDEVVARLDKEE